jgi:pimeloyl-ACP methyl ester carboxylesterase
LGPAGIVSAQHILWLVGMVYRFQIRSITPAAAENAFDTWVMPQHRPRLRRDPWRPIAQQLITGMGEFQLSTRRVRPVRCKIDRLAASDIPVLALVPRDETLHDGPTMAKRFRQQLPNARVTLVDDANHLVPIDQPDVVAEELRQFLEQRPQLGRHKGP